jgi:hypothetical protein
MHDRFKILTVILVASAVLSADLASAADKFGAIALSTKTGKYAIIVNAASRAAAEKEALKKCGSQGCAIKALFKNSCGAIAQNGKRVGYGLGADQSAAEKKAKMAAGGTAAKVIKSACAK